MRKVLEALKPDTEVNMEERPILEVKNLAVTYKTRRGDVPAVRDVSFTVGSGRNIGLVGESGCGKSTVAFALVNYLGRNGAISNGSILFKGSEMRNRSPRELRSLRGGDIAMVYQEPMSALNPTMTIGRQMIESLVTHQGISSMQARTNCLKALADVYMPEPESVLGRYAHQISGGQQQRVLIAMALLNNPSLLIMDEPTTALDVTVEAAVLDLIAELQKKYHTATVFISHNLGVIARVSDQVAVMYAGELVELAEAGDVYKKPLHPYTVGLMKCLPNVDAPRGSRTLSPIPGRVPSRYNMPPGCVFAPRCEYAISECRQSPPDLVEISPGHFSRCIRSETWLSAPPWQEELGVTGTGKEEIRVAETESILTVDRVKTYYPMPFKTLKSFVGAEKRRYVKAVDNVSFTLNRGCALGIVGESGCGKSTLAKSIVGLEQPTRGHIGFLGLDITNVVEKRDRDTIREIQMVFQNPDGTLNPSYGVGDQIATSVRRFRDLPRDQVRSTVVELLKAVKLDEAYYGRYPRQLSGGEKQRVGIARAIAGHPKMLICDEPVSALDVSVQAAILTLMDEIQQRFQTTIVLISHDLSTVRFFSDYVAVMYLGRLVEVGPVEAIYRPPYHPYTAALLAAVPRPDPSIDSKCLRLSGNVPSPVNPPQGCRFNTRCPHKKGRICETTEPPELDLGNHHRIYCHLDGDALGLIGKG